MTAVDVLLKIIDDKTIMGSDTAKGFIVGSRRAVCFQDAPLLGLAQNIAFEKEVSPKMGRDPSYEGCGVSFSKVYAFGKGARPVLYELTDIGKAILPPEEHWRIVRLDLGNKDALIDWTHEREWRCPDEFAFHLSACAVVVGDSAQYRELMEKIEPAVLKALSGVTVLAHSTA